MRPLLFGNRKAPLFGLHHPPIAAGARDIGVLLCNPFGQEAVRAHRAYRQLALALARARFHVLRFDYSGTGDSAGQSDGGTIKAWSSDIVSASEELRDTAGVSKVAWVGLRLGATLALLAAQGRKDVDRLVAWDPVVRGSEYLAELHRLHQDFMRAEHRWWKPSVTDASCMVEALGFPTTDTLKAELVAVDLSVACKLSAKRTAFVISENTDAQRALRQRLLVNDALPSSIVWKEVPASAWNSEAAMNSSLVPMDAIQAIVSYLSEGRP